MADGGVISGRGGTVTIGAPYTNATTVMHIYEWTGVISSDEWPATEFDSGGADEGHEHGIGMYEMTGHLRAFLDSATPPAIGWFQPDRDEAAIVLTSFNATTDQQLSFNGHLHNFVIGVDKQSGIGNTIECDFVSCGAVTPQTGAT